MLTKLRFNLIPHPEIQFPFYRNFEPNDKRKLNDVEYY